MSSIVPSARVAIPTLVNKKNLAVCKVEHENKSHHSEPACYLAKHPIYAYTWDTACTEKNTFRREIKYNGGPAYCLLKPNPKQTSTFFNCECKFPPCTTDDERTVEIISTFKFFVISSFF